MFGIKNTKKVNVICDEVKVTELLTRGVENVYPKLDFLKGRLMSGERLTLYLGIDPTGPTLHLGHGILIKKLKEFQDLGHEIILLIGDFTGMIGDPTDKSATRKKLTREQVLENAKEYVKQASVFLNFKGENPALVKYNSEWLGKMSFGDVLELSSLVTVDQMLKRDMFDNRVKEGKPIYLHEFMYPLMQGYDCVAMNVDGEIGGNDQTFNMLVGRDFLKILKNKEKFVLTGKLLTDSAGKKMGKTEGNMVSLDQDAGEMFGKIMSWADGLIIPAFELCTYLKMEEIQEMDKKLKEGASDGINEGINPRNPRDFKFKLATEIVKIYHGEAKAKEAGEDFEKTFKKGGVPEDIMEVNFAKDTRLGEILLAEGLVKSKSEFARLVDEGAVSAVGKEAIKTHDFKISESAVWKIGKRRFIKINIKG
ncbi:MAG: tyrosine--tRNA ligase [bacterium]|nr:tyrosine--tRNA ligase [bacterium]